MTPRKPLLTALLLASLIGNGAFAPGAAAQDGRAQLSETQRQQVRDHYERGTRFYNVAKYGEAIDEYQKAYLISADPVMLYNIAQAYRMWDQPVEAIRFYRNYLRNAPTAPNRTEVEKRIAELERVAEERRRAPTTTPPATEPPPAATPPPVTPPPTAQTSPSPRPSSSTPPPLGGPTPVSPPAGAVGVRVPPPKGSSGTRIFGWTMVGIGGALVATSVVLGAVAAGKAKDVEDAAKSGGRFDPEVEKAGKAANAGAIATALLGIAAGVTGGVLLVAGSSASDAQAARPKSSSVASVYPLAAPGFAGAAASFRF
jgi:tetratricopeptide (TPR) repeat protein